MSTVRLITELNLQIENLEIELDQSFEKHPDAEIYCSLTGLGTIVSGRVLGEFGDDRTRYLDAKSRKNYAGTSPITKASGKHFVALSRYARNEHLFDACFLWGFSSLTKSPGAWAYYDALRARGKTHNQALKLRRTAGSGFCMAAFAIDRSTARKLPGRLRAPGQLDS